MAGKPPTLDAAENDEAYLRYIKSNLNLRLLLIKIFSIFNNTSTNLLEFPRNLQFAADQLESTGIIGVIEPINNYSVPGYYLNSYDKGVM